MPDVEILYNPDLKSAPVMIPGLLGMVTMLATTLLVALGIVREREYGTLEQLAVTPLRLFEVGKLLPYIVLAGVDFVLVLVAGLTVFGLEPAGSLALFTGLTLLFLLSTVGLGVLGSAVSENQQQAMQLAFFVMFPQILMSGLIFPISSMPRVIQWISTVLPFTYFVPIARGISLKGQGLDVLWPQAAVLAGYGVLLTRRRHRAPAAAAGRVT
ncbi:ABC transporter permease [Thermaerobacter subterraneus]|uniref:ABC transporter permease n=1 Tax=Thermaerobacter subterraneus TaxID=175696 RepID=UPI000313B3F3|nr:ABC transporter permease [Thermaerobacter subterraneus]